MELEETTKSETSFATELGKQTLATVVVTAASVAAAYAAMLVVGGTISAVAKLKARRESKKTVDTDTE